MEENHLTEMQMLLAEAIDAQTENDKERLFCLCNDMIATLEDLHSTLREES